MQEVNLLSEELKPQHNPFTIREFAIVWGSLALLLTAISGWQLYTNWQLDQDLATKRQLLSVANIEYSSLESAVKNQADPALVQQLNKVLSRRKEQWQLASILETEPMNSGFQQHLTDLARINMRDLWLNSISLTEGGKNIHLKGFSSNAERVPVFLSMLAGDSAFAGYPFDGLQIKRETKSLVSFEVHGPLAGDQL